MFHRNVFGAKTSGIWQPPTARQTDIVTKISWSWPRHSSKTVLGKQELMTLMDIIRSLQHMWYNWVELNQIHLSSDLADLVQKCNPLRGATRHFCVWHMIFTYIFHTDCQKTNLLMHLMSAWAPSCPLLVGDYVSNARLVLGSLNHHTK